MSSAEVTSQSAACFIRLTTTDHAAAEQLAAIFAETTPPVVDHPTELTIGVERDGPAIWIILRGNTLPESRLDAFVRQVIDGSDHCIAQERLHGNEQPGIVGPGRADDAQLAVVAVRQLRDRQAANAVLDLLAKSGDEWKRTFPGFIAAVPFLSEASNVLINYPSWTGEAAYNAWMSDPRMRVGQKGVSNHESAAPRYHLINITLRKELVAR